MFSEGKGDFYPGDEIGCFSECEVSLSQTVMASTQVRTSHLVIFFTAKFLLCDNRIANVSGSVMYT